MWVYHSLLSWLSIFSVTGFDLDKKRINQLEENYDRTGEVEQSAIENSNLALTFNASQIKNSNVYIYITVPSPVDKNNNPDFRPLKNASKTVGSLNKGDVVIYESTVYPGATEDIFVPILAFESGLSYNSEFFCGYSPRGLIQVIKIIR